MANNVVKIATWNCQGIKANTHGIKELCKTCDILMIQETWLESWEMSFINEIDINFQGKGISGMDDTREVKRGRPYGGDCYFVEEIIG